MIGIQVSEGLRGDKMVISVFIIPICKLLVKKKYSTDDVCFVLLFCRLMSLYVILQMLLQLHSQKLTVKFFVAYT